MKKLLFIIYIITILFACEKDSGEGGTSTINGKVMYFTISFNSQTNSNDTTYYPKAGKDIYIIYGDDENQIYNDNFETDWDGNFHFQYLRKGNYIIYTYVDSVAVNNVTYDYPVFKHVTISENNSVNTLTDFIIQD